MRLTLRTLLAYLDDMLEPAQAKLIGQKIAESETAQELIERIRQVTRRRRITTPPPPGPGAKLDPNTIAEYLDNTLATEQLNDVEGIFLASDVHLAEIAASHQILTLVLGEPALVPPTAKQRMYGLVKGPEAIPFRKPPQGSYTPEGELVEENREADETLRLGIPAVARGSLAGRLAMVGGGALIGGLLVLAIFMVLSGRKDDPKNQQFVQADPGKDTERDLPKKDSEEKAPGTGEVKKDEPPEPVKKDAVVDKKETPGKAPPMDLPFAPPSPKQAGIANFVPPETADVSILLQFDPKLKSWQRVGLKTPKVMSGRPLLSLPGCRSVVQLESGLRLILWGSFPEIWPLPPLLESSVELHQHDILDADLTLDRGRIALANSKTWPTRARIRFANPTKPDYHEFVDLTLEKGSEILCERWSFFSPGEPFYLDPKDPHRQGPTAAMAFLVVAGNVRFRTSDLSVYALSAPPGNALVVWNSQKVGFDGPQSLPKVPEGATINPPPPPKADAKAWAALRSGVINARDQLSRNLGSRQIEVVLAETLKAEDKNLRQLAVRCYGALDDVGNLIDALEQEKYQDVRTAAIGTLRAWITTARDNEYKVFDALAGRYRNSEREKIIELLHGFTDKQWAQPSTYEILIDYLDNAKLAIRELAATHLYQRIPAGVNILYDGMWEAPRRQAAQNAWRALIVQLSQRQQPMPMGK